METVADLEGAEPAPPPLGDGPTPSLTVLLICDNGRPTGKTYCIL